MKSIFRFLTAALLVLFSLVIFTPAVADPPDPPPMPYPHGYGGDVNVASVDNGLYLLLAFGIVYGTLAFIRARRKEQEAGETA
jgi:hypothetical protein